MPPLISVIMPAYNAEKFIKQAIDSILNQTFKDFEFLIINDGSVDNTKMIIEDYVKCDARVKLINQERNQGIVAALNVGLKQALGKYIARMDSDDIARPDRFALQVNFLEKHPEMAIVGGGYAPFSTDSKRSDIFHVAGSLEIAWRFLSNTQFCHPTVMFRKELINDCGLYPPQEAEDYAYFSRIIKKYRGANLRRVLIDYREHPKSRSFASKKEISQSVMNVFRENYRYYIGQMEFVDEFFRFQHDNLMTFGFLLKSIKINKQIISRICRDYNMNQKSGEVYVLWLKIIFKCVKGLIKNYLFGKK